MFGLLPCLIHSDRYLPVSRKPCFPRDSTFSPIFCSWCADCNCLRYVCEALILMLIESIINYYYDHVSTLDACLWSQHEVHYNQALQASAATTTDQTTPTSFEEAWGPTRLPGRATLPSQSRPKAASTSHQRLTNPAGHKLIPSPLGHLQGQGTAVPYPAWEPCVVTAGWAQKFI